MQKRNGTQAHSSHWGICTNTWRAHSRYQSARGSEESATDCGRCGLWEPEGRAGEQGRCNRGGIPVEMGTEADRWGGGGDVMRLTSAGLLPETSRPRRCSSARSSSTRSLADISSSRSHPCLPRAPRWSREGRRFGVRRRVKGNGRLLEV
jgi:hypothetical protein